MAEYLIQEQTLTGIADKIRVLSGEQETLSPAEMEVKLTYANDEIDFQNDLIDQMLLKLDSLKPKYTWSVYNAVHEVYDRENNYEYWFDVDTFEGYNTSFTVADSYEITTDGRFQLINPETVSYQDVQVGQYICSDHLLYEVTEVYIGNGFTTTSQIYYIEYGIRTQKGDTLLFETTSDALDYPYDGMSSGDGLWYTLSNTETVPYVWAIHFPMHGIDESAGGTSGSFTFTSTTTRMAASSYQIINDTWDDFSYNWSTKVALIDGVAKTAAQLNVGDYFFRYASVDVNEWPSVCRVTNVSQTSETSYTISYEEFTPTTIIQGGVDTGIRVASETLDYPVNGLAPYAEVYKTGAVNYYDDMWFTLIQGNS